MVGSVDALTNAFRTIDFICRQSQAPSGEHLLLRSLCFRAMDDLAAAAKDLRDAGLHDGADLRVQLALLESGENGVPILEAARLVLDHSHATDSDRCRAISVLLRSSPIVVQASRDRATIRGFVGWQGDTAPILSLAVDGGTHSIAFRPRSQVARNMAAFDLAHPGDQPARIEARLGTSSVESLLLTPLLKPSRPSPAVIAGMVSVVIPVFGGLAATRACFEALEEQRSRSRLDVIVVDDACPDPELARFAEAACERNGWLHFRNAMTEGFAAAVNHGASAGRGEHVLLLNADAILPPGAIDRLVAAARHPDVGTVVPFSNDGGFTSLPRMRARNDVPTREVARRWDRATEAANRGRVVDLPTGTAFCMLVTRRCWDALGGLDQGYGRGYFEDVDFCLRAKRLGLRNVLAADLFVLHVGSQSFGAGKRALAANNALVIRERFPDYEIDWACFVEADPLASLRGAMERMIPPPEPLRLLVGRASRLGPLLDARAADLARSGVRVIGLSWTRDGVALLRAFDGGFPQSLRFHERDAEALTLYLSATDIRGIDVAEPDAVPQWLSARLAATGGDLSVYAADRSAARFLQRTNLNWRGAGLTAADDMTAAALGQERGHLGRPRHCHAAGGAPTGGVRIAALLPRCTVAADRLLTALDRRLCRAGGDLVIFGQALGRGRACARATGPMDPSDYADGVRHYRATHLLLPDPDAPFRLLEDLWRHISLPAAYHDGSDGRFRPHPSDHVIRSGAHESAAEAIVMWSHGARHGEWEPGRLAS